MRSVLNPLLAVFLAGILAACSSTPTEDDSSATDTMPQQTDTSSTQPMQRPQPKPDSSNIPLTAENFHNHPSNYDGTTNTKVIYFAFDSNTVPAAAFETLRAHATYLKNNPNAKVRLGGHADERGTREYNVALSERRSESVQKFLRVQGVSSSQIEVVAYGEEKPAAYGHSEMDWAKNRRVVIDYLAGRP
ncbi:peptidoglycan-associated lipoprotein Pal [Alloalcanivorax mobilis]|uniref:peptidoglycan-associated lipoprotein Pal n=1 Tax=Alloalcanivorax mobilis TaxID=2019569 RepID=UPI000C760E81|nr:peptidoglycan-associated lipoprotein Pal [Alloalcanivorax mobilis]